MKPLEIDDELIERIMGKPREEKKASEKFMPQQRDRARSRSRARAEATLLRKPLTTEEIQDLFAGASDTSLMTVEWAMAEMMKNTTTMHKAQEEVRQVFADKEKFDDAGLHDLKYLKLVIKETLRLHPPVALIPRECSETSQIHGYDIYPKTKVLVNAWAIGRDSDSWTNPEMFYPERFLESSVDYKGTNFQLIPFGSGKRMCPGIVMAMAIIEPLLARVLLQFDWKLPNGAHPESLDMSDDFGLVVKRKSDLNLIPTTFCTSPIE